METLKDRLIQYVTYKGMSMRKFSLSIGKPATFLASMRKATSEDVFLKILEVYPDISPNWLLTGNGEMLENKEEQERRKVAISNLRKAEGMAREFEQEAIRKLSFFVFTDRLYTLYRYFEKLTIKTNSEEPGKREQIERDFYNTFEKYLGSLYKLLAVAQHFDEQTYKIFKNSPDDLYLLNNPSNEESTTEPAEVKSTKRR